MLTRQTQSMFRGRRGHEQDVLDAVIVDLAVGHIRRANQRRSTMTPTHATILATLDVATAYDPNRVAIEFLAASRDDDTREATRAWVSSEWVRAQIRTHRQPSVQSTFRTEPFPFETLLPMVRMVDLLETAAQWSGGGDGTGKGSGGTTTTVHQGGGSGGQCPSQSDAEYCTGVIGSVWFGGNGGGPQAATAPDGIDGSNMPTMPVVESPWHDPNSPCYGLAPENIFPQASDPGGGGGSGSNFYPEPPKLTTEQKIFKKAVMKLLTWGFPGPGHIGKVVDTVLSVAIDQAFAIGNELGEAMSGELGVTPTPDIYGSDGELLNNFVTPFTNKIDNAVDSMYPYQKPPGANLPNPNNTNVDLCAQHILGDLASCLGAGPFGGDNGCDLAPMADCAPEEPMCHQLRCSCNNGDGSGGGSCDMTLSVELGDTEATWMASTTCGSGGSDDCYDASFSVGGFSEGAPVESVSASGELCGCDPACANAPMTPDGFIDCDGCSFGGGQSGGGLVAACFSGLPMPPGLIEVCGAIDPVPEVSQPSAM